MTAARPLLSSLILLPALAFSSPAQTVPLPAGTPLAAYLNDHIPMKVGQPVRAALLYPVYAGDTVVFPERTVLEGKIVAITPDKERRIRARLRGDFTPFRKPVVHFTAIALTNGPSVPLNLGEATDGAPFLRIVPPPPSNGLVKQAVARARQAVHDQVQFVTAPGLGDRLVQNFYMGLPYHPQRIEKFTAWSFETNAPFTLPPGATPLTLPDPPSEADAKQPDLKTDDRTPAWLLRAFLTERLDSATTAVGQTIHAVVAQPVFNEDRTIAVPVGAVLTGTVLSVHPARSFGRTGTLHFAFNQLSLPEGAPRGVQATLAGVDTQGNLALDSEGQVKAAANNNFLMPLLLAGLATRALHTEHDGDGERLGKNATGANGFGLIGSVIGAAGQSPQLAAAIGYYGTALTIYQRFIAHGEQVVFLHDTRVIVQTSARRSSPMKASPPAAMPSSSPQP